MAESCFETHFILMCVTQCYSVKPYTPLQECPASVAPTLLPTAHASILQYLPIPRDWFSRNVCGFITWSVALDRELFKHCSDLRSYLISRRYFCIKPVYWSRPDLARIRVSPLQECIAHPTVTPTLHCPRISQYLAQRLYMPKLLYCNMRHYCM